MTVFMNIRKWLLHAAHKNLCYYISPKKIASAHLKLCMQIVDRLTSLVTRKIQTRDIDPLDNR